MTLKRKRNDTVLCLYLNNDAIIKAPTADCGDSEEKIAPPTLKLEDTLIATQFHSKLLA